VKHRCLQGDVDGLAAAGGTETLLQTAGCDLDKHLGQFQPRCMEVAGIHIRRSVVASERLDDFWPAPAEIADAPSGEEIDIAAALAIEQQTAFATRDLQAVPVGFDAEIVSERGLAARLNAAEAMAADTIAIRVSTAVYWGRGILANAAASRKA